MITKEQACDFAADWIDSWNEHDIERIMSHYHDDVEYFSIFLAQLSGVASGMLQGKDKLRQYLMKGLEAYPKLHFKLLGIYVGVGSVTIEYESVNNLIAAEVFELDEQSLVKRVQCHYQYR